MVKLHGFDIQFFLLLLICLAGKVRYVVSPYGSDAQIAFLISKVFQILKQISYQGSENYAPINVKPLGGGGGPGIGGAFELC